ncbi:MAG: ATP-binding protein [Epsilonproteobacteria bacterium]|nr:ATP-binding protein [Campylobacterota bacterium]
MIARSAEKDIIEGAKSFPVVAILGPRQSGKTTTARTVFNQHVYLTLEDLDLRAAAKNDPRTFLKANANEHGIIIDEFQHVPELLSYIQTMVDQQRKPGEFVLTGSQNFLMNQAIGQSLAGRVSIHTLLPLSTGELGKHNILPTDIEPTLYQGFYPAIYAHNIEPARLYQNYFHTYIERDVRQLAQVGDLMTFQTFVRLCAARAGQVLNLTSLGNDCGISDTTAKKWLSVLQASYVIFLLQPFHKNFGKRLIKSPKLYFYDPGLMCYLLGIKQQELALHSQRGALFESLVITEILKHFYNRGKTPQVYFWRDKTGHEIDCIVQEGQKLTLVEIKSSRTINQRFFDGINYWKSFATDENIESFVVFAGGQDQGRSRPDLVSWQSINDIFCQENRQR